MQTLLSTQLNNGFSIARLTLGLVIFPHGAQKMLGLFGGFGFTGTIEFFIQQMGLPFIVALSVIIIEFFGSISLILGFLSRFWAIAFIGLFLGIIFMSQLQNGFFMNWFGNQDGEGFEYSILIIGLALSTLINGSGRYAFDNIIYEKVNHEKNSNISRKQQ